MFYISSKWAATQVSRIPARDISNDIRIAVKATGSARVEALAGIHWHWGDEKVFIITISDNGEVLECYTVMKNSTREVFPIGIYFP